MTVADVSTADTAARAPEPPRRCSDAVSAWRAFRAILWRDVFVTGKEFWVLLIQVAIAPLFMLLIFAKVLGKMDIVNNNYGHTLLPGIVALSTFLAALQSVALPLVMEFGFTREIEDRLLAPIPTTLVAVEKLIVAGLRGLVSAIVIYPCGALIIGATPWRTEGVALLVMFLVLGAWAGGGVGMTIGTFVPPHRINIMFGLIITPIMFTGAVQYPWSSLDSMRWFQVITSINPLTYCAEGIRGAMVPEVAHLPPATAALALCGFALAFTGLGIVGFRRRSLS